MIQPYSRGIASSITNVLASVAATRLMLNVRNRRYKSQTRCNTIPSMHFLSRSAVVEEEDQLRTDYSHDIELSSHTESERSQSVA